MVEVDGCTTHPFESANGRVDAAGNDLLGLGKKFG
jgi:hypothetical protein